MTYPSKLQTVHSRRTMMFDELSKLMDFSSGDGTEFNKLLKENVIDKQTDINKSRTNGALLSLYLLNDEVPIFKMFHYLWGIAPDNEKRILALLLALYRDVLLSDSLETVLKVSPGLSVTVSSLQDCIGALYPNKYTPKTLLSLSQNIASSWKQSGHITGRYKNIRTKVTPGYHAVTFALFLGYMDGLRGDFLFQPKWIKALDSTEKELKALAHAAAQRDLISFQSAGSVTVINFNLLIQKLNIHGIEN
jgi:hypothetical protein